MVKKLVGISGVARSGKDMFASILINQLKAAGKTVVKYALADALKGDCDEFCKKYMGFSSFTQIPEQKTLIRPLLVWYGDAQRKRTNGRYWIDIIESKMKSSDADFGIVTDVRYSHYDKDEVQWVIEDRRGILVHISRYVGEERDFIKPANDHEMLNDPKVRAAATHRVEWEHIGGLSQNDLLQEPRLNKHISKFLISSGLISASE